MAARLSVISVSAVILFSIAFVGCRARVEKPPEEPLMTEATAMVGIEEISPIMPETIPPTAAGPAIKEAVTPAQQDKSDRNKNIQIALKNAGFYAGTIDGKIGPKTKKAIQEFQGSKALKVDGKVGPRTWAELERYLRQ